MVEVFPANRHFDVELERETVIGGSPQGDAATVFIFEAGGSTIFRDKGTDPTAQARYRSRLIRDGYLPGPWTLWSDEASAVDGGEGFTFIGDQNWMFARTSSPSSAHESRVDNPHLVTAAQVGAPTLADLSFTNATLSSHLANTTNPHAVTAAQVGAATTGALAATDANLASHEADTGNPHSVTAAQVGAPTVADLSSHESDSGNPHAVTAAQVGLGNVEDVALSGWGGSASLVTVGALNAGSITNGFGSINIGSSALSAGALSVSSGDFAGNITVHRDTNAQINLNAHVDNGTPTIIFRRSRGTEISPSAVNSGQTIAAISGRAYDGSSYVNSAQITILANENQSAGNSGSRVQIDLTANGSGVKSTYYHIRAEAFRPDSAYHGSISLGATTARWSNVYSTDGDFSGDITVAGLVDGVDVAGLSASYLDHLVDFDNPHQVDVTDFSGGSFGAGNYTFPADVTIGTLGTFDGSDTPVDGEFLRYHESSGEWRSVLFQKPLADGDVVAEALLDGTAAAFVNSNPTLSGTPGAPGSAPVLTPIYKGMIIDMSSRPLAAGEVYVLDYDSGGGFTTDAIISTSDKVVHTKLGLGATYAYRYKIRGASDSSNSPSTAATAPSSIAEVSAFGILVAAQGAFADLASLSVNAGAITAGSLASATLTNNFVDLNATGSDVFVSAGDGQTEIDAGTGKGFYVLADGSVAKFAGELVAASGTFSGTVSSTTFTGLTATFAGNITLYDGGDSPGYSPTLQIRSGANGVPAIQFRFGTTTAGSIVGDSANQIRFRNGAGTEIARVDGGWKGMLVGGGQATPQLVVSGTGNAFLGFSDDEIALQGEIAYQHSSDDMHIAINADGILNPSISILSAGGSAGHRDVRIGDGSALATNATGGFLLIPGCAGTPTGTPSNAGLGAVAVKYDTVNKLLYANDGGGWNAV